MTTTTPTRSSGLGRVLIAAYGLLALAATGRAVVQIVAEFDDAPFAYSLTGLAAVVYIVATIALLVPGRTWYRIAVITISFELVGVLVVGTLSVFDAELFADNAVWSFFGRGYAFVPLVLPILGIIWLYRKRPRPAAAVGQA